MLLYSKKFKFVELIITQNVVSNNKFILFSIWFRLNLFSFRLGLLWGFDLVLKIFVSVSVWFLKILFQFVVEFWFEIENFSSYLGLISVWKSVLIFRVQGEKILYAWNKEKGFWILFEKFSKKFTNKEEKSLKSFIGSWEKICELKWKS